MVHVRHHNIDRDGKLLEGDLGAMGTVVMVKERGNWSIISAQNTIVQKLPPAFRQGEQPHKP